jgi:hypothetical protein
MSKNDFLVQTERKVFRASFQDGLIDIGIAAFTLMMALGPLLSVPLGDFWASFVFLPFWGLLYLLLRWVRRQFVIPRIGTVTFGVERIAKLKRGGIVILVLNILFLGIGAITFFFPGDIGFSVALRFSAVTLIFFSMVGYFYDLPQLYVYGALSALSIPVGEWLWQQELASHHGYPVVFGALTAIIFLRGLYQFIRLMQIELPPIEDQPNTGHA